MIWMFIGACLLTGAYGPTDQVFLSVFCFSLFFYAVGERLGLRIATAAWCQKLPLGSLLLETGTGACRAKHSDRLM